MRSRAVAPILLIVFALGGTACGSPAPAGTVSDSARASASAHASGASPQPYLALGDSVAFGYVASATPAPGGGDAYADQANFAGYPRFAGAALHLTTFNAACPGETSGSMLDVHAPDNGCHQYRALFPLHVTYTGTQLQYADTFLREHHDTALVSLGIGANDGLLVVAQCGGVGNMSCIQQQLPTVVSTLRGNLTSIIQSLRATGYRGSIVLVNFYSLSYADARVTDLVSTLDSAIAAVAGAEHLQVADAFTAFKDAAQPSGDTCAAGLLGPGTSMLGHCDLHPDTAGQQLIATVVARAARQGVAQQ